MSTYWNLKKDERCGKRAEVDCFGGEIPNRRNNIEKLFGGEVMRGRDCLGAGR